MKPHLEARDKLLRERHDQLLVSLSSRMSEVFFRLQKEFHLSRARLYRIIHHNGKNKKKSTVGS